MTQKEEQIKELIAWFKHYHHHTHHHNEDLKAYQKELRDIGRADLAEKVEACIAHQDQVARLIDEVLTGLK